MTKAAKKPVGLTVKQFIRHFTECTRWKCEPETRLTHELTAFATEHLGSTRNIEELHVIFCTARDIRPYPEGTTS